MKMNAAELESLEILGTADETGEETSTPLGTALG